MCGRVVQVLSPTLIAEVLGTTLPLFNAPPRHNGAPRQEMIVARANPETGKRSLDLLVWGLVPSRTKDLKTAPRPINARSETVRTNAMFKSAFAKRRCILPIDAFFEWKPNTNPKQPYAIARKDRSMLALAGIWENWQDPHTKEWLRTFALLTTSANALVGKIHNRMPVILRERDHGKWLGDEPADADALEALFAPYPEDQMEMWAVNPRINSWRYDADDTLEPYQAVPTNSL